MLLKKEAYDKSKMNLSDAMTIRYLEKSKIRKGR